jgi:hypothetical protein
MSAFMFAPGGFSVVEARMCHTFHDCGNTWSVSCYQNSDFSNMSRWNGTDEAAHGADTVHWGTPIRAARTTGQARA